MEVEPIIPGIKNDSPGSVPTIAPAIVENILPELQDDQWVNWKYLWRQNDRDEWKLTKVPRTPYNTAASHGNPETWADFERVVIHAEESDSKRGIGRVFSEADPYCGCDFDNCLDDSGAVKEWAEPWITELRERGAYIEVSPSGTGLKAIVRATLPGNGRRTKIADGEIEVYDRLRFFTFTGDTIAAPENIPDAQETIDGLLSEVMGPEKDHAHAEEWGESNGLSDERVIEIASKAEKFRRAWTGDYGDFGDDASRGDAYVAHMLNWAGRDPYQTERIMRGNPNLYRAKWDNHAAYLLERTIMGAVPGEVYNPSDDARLNLGGGGLGGWTNLNDYASGNIKPIPQIVAHQMYSGLTTLIHSKPGKGKTLLAIYQTKAALDAGLTVMYLDAENGPQMFVERALGMGITDFSQVHYNGSPEPDLNGWVERFLHDVDNKKPDVVFFDSFADFLAMCGLNENDSMDLTKFFTAVIKPLRDRGIATVILDHEPWEGRGHARGSTAKLAKVDVEWELRQSVPFDRERVGEITLHLRKDRPAQLGHSQCRVLPPRRSPARSTSPSTPSKSISRTRSTRWEYEVAVPS